MDEQLYRLQFERADLLKRIDEDQDDLNGLMQKHKDLIAQVRAPSQRVYSVDVMVRGKMACPLEGSFTRKTLTSYSHLPIHTPIHHEPVHQSVHSAVSWSVSHRSEEIL